MELDQFVGKIIKLGAGLGVTIPAKTVEFAGVEEGDLIKVLFKKVEPPKPKTENDEEK